jgi:hypothetical protein
MKFYVYDKTTLRPLKVYSCDPEQHGVSNGDAAAGCEHAAALLINAVGVAGSFSPPDGSDFSKAPEEQVPPLSKASMLPPTDKQIEAYKAAILADAERVIAASREASK